VRKTLIEEAKVLWMEGGKGRERPLWIEIEGRKLPVLDWEGKLFPHRREFRVKTPAGSFLVEVEGEEVRVYSLAL